MSSHERHERYLLSPHQLPSYHERVHEAQSRPGHRKHPHSKHGNTQCKKKKSVIQLFSNQNVALSNEEAPKASVTTKNSAKKVVADSTKPSHCKKHKHKNLHRNKAEENKEAKTNMKKSSHHGGVPIYNQSLTSSQYGSIVEAEPSPQIKEIKEAKDGLHTGTIKWNKRSIPQSQSGRASPKVSPNKRRHLFDSRVAQMKENKSFIMSHANS